MSKQRMVFTWQERAKFWFIYMPLFMLGVYQFAHSVLGK
jgi:hypothetical protein